MLGNARIAALSLEELIERRNLYLREFWYGYHLYFNKARSPNQAHRAYLPLTRIEECAKLARIYESYIALFEE